MKKLTAILLGAAMLAGCTGKTDNTPEPTEDFTKSEGVMTYAEYAAADLDTEVTIEAYVQGHQSWWDDKITVYAQDPDGAYFLYNMACTEADAAKLVDGQKIKVTGYKSEWAGETEIIDAAFEIEEGNWIAEAVNADDLWGSVDLITRQNQKVLFTGLTVEAYDETGAAFAYKNAEEKTDDLYFKVTKGDTTYDFVVEFYLTGADTDVYKAVEGLKVGDVIDVEGFLYWYEGPNLHTTKVTVK
ncbi:MAG: hypothetical protein IIY52_07335 [Solobacterium sp.]|nr:hypothetical protein [Erysipelotrichaceae bacterium]MBQ1325806.1 hypothetical protein [Solobacterium sp.]MBQ2690126.1 hypothetical protein [Solobacterium sp.]MBQ6592096.1 hypothetical protein [Solobacterium sp.]MBR0478736.1 hypothetical protein [Solobacterium sp.]